jgi:beta-glucosidase
MNVFTNFVFISLLSLAISLPCFGNVTGKVVDQSGAPVPNAMVMYTKIDWRLIWAYADANGNFSLLNPTTGTIRSRHGLANFSAAINASVNGNSLYFTTNGKNPVTISVFSLAGKFISSKTLDNLSAGRFSVQPFGFMGNKNARTVYVVRIKSGLDVSHATMINVGTPDAASIPGGRTSENARNMLAKQEGTTAIDQIRVGRTSYTPKILDINSYDDNVGNVAITWFDVEKKIDSIFAANDINVLAGQGVQMEFSKNAGTVSLGSIFGGGGIAPPGANNAASWATWVDGFKTTYANNGPKIPILFGYDAVHGCNVCVTATILPHNIALGATHDPALVEKAERVTALEVTGTGANYGFGPCIATVRHLRWGRTYEGYGETPSLSKVMAAAATLGRQSWDMSSPYAICADCKHYAGDGGSGNGDNPGTTNTGPDDVLRAIHVEPYKAAVDKELGSVMASFSSWGPLNQPMHVCKELLTNVLKGQYGFTGFIQGDWGSAVNLDGFMAGLDQPMNLGDAAGVHNVLKGMLAAGGDQQTRAKDIIRRMLRVKIKMGLFNKNPLTDRNITATVGSQLHRDVARECVRKSLVLLKNEGPVLPISKTAKIRVIGEHADNIGLLCGGWTISWQGDPIRTQVSGGTTIYQGFQKLTKGRVQWSADATGIAADDDVIVVVVGERPCAEWDGTSNGELSLDGTKYSFNGDASWYFCSIYNKNNYTQLIADCAATGKPVVCILITMRPMIITEEIKNTKAMVAGWLPGSEAGGIAEVLYGDYDFSGTLPHTWPATYSQEPINDGNLGDKVGTGGAPLFPYGFGLSYKGQLPKPAF